jgi:hypothetical protein
MKILLIILIVGIIMIPKLKSQLLIPRERFTTDTIMKKKLLPNQFRDYVEWCKTHDTTRIVFFYNKKLRM